ncbi:hypothetical protein TALC_00369 [Thermoplasmatales archaeon BRNA1]|nr:hypothetical protein TALC_00369 [Thermoplasmatales archaeon BRNA1]
MRYLILVDESGDPKRESRSKEFTMTASINSDPRILEEIVDTKPRGTRYPTKPELKDELKYFSSNDRVRTETLKDILATNPRIYAVHLNKEEAKKESSRAVYHRSVRELMELVMGDPMLKTSDAAIDIVFDRHNLLGPNDAARFAKNAAKHNGIMTIDEIRCDRSIENRCLQAHDFLAGAIGAKYNQRKTEDFSIIEDVVIVRTIHLKN